MIFIPLQYAHAETMEEQLNNLVGPKKQYGTQMSPVYLKNNYTEEHINPRSGELTLTQTDYVLPGRNGLDLEIKRIYKSGISNVQEMKVKYVRGAWVDYVDYDAKTSSFYEERYNLGIGMRFSFPAMEIKHNTGGSSHKFLHTESGDIYRLKAVLREGQEIYLPEGQTIKDVYIRKSTDFTNGQNDGTSHYVMTGKDGKKTYFAEDGRILGIVDRYGNMIQFEYTTLTYKIDSTTITKRLISKITDAVGRVVTIRYTDDASYTVGAAGTQQYGGSESYKASQNPNTEDSGDLKGKFRVIVRLPGDKEIVYDKSAVLVSRSKHVIRTRIQRVYDVDGKPKYHYWYEQPSLGFTYMNGTRYSAYNRYENLVQIDYCKTNRIKRYTYHSYTKKLNRDQGSMQYRKIFDKKELVKKGYDAGQAEFLNKFTCDVKDKRHYAYENEADGFGTEGYKEHDSDYLQNTYRYSTLQTDAKEGKVKYTYDGLHQLISTEKSGKDHKEVITTEHDEMKLIKKKETRIYRVENEQASGSPVKKIENFRYDQYGNLTNYTSPLAARDQNGYPTDNEHTVTYAYAYDRYHILTLKTWKQDAHTTCQIGYDVDYKGNILRQKRVHTGAGGNIVTDYAYDEYGNMIRKTVHSPDNTYVTRYEYGRDADGVDHKGVYLTKEYAMIDSKEAATHYTYDFNSGSMKAKIDANGNRTDYEHDLLDRVIKITYPDAATEHFAYKEGAYTNREIEYTDPEGIKYLSDYDICGDRVHHSVRKNDQWQPLQQIEYDANRNKVKEVNSNGHSIRFEYDSTDRLVKKSYYENDTVLKEEIRLSYTVGADADTPLLMTMTDEDGYEKRFRYDILNRLIKLEVTPDQTQYYATGHTYDYVGNKRSTTDARGHTTRYTYDDQARLVKKTDPLGYETVYTYNSLDKVLTMQEPGEKVTEYLYDVLGRVKQQKTYQKGETDAYHQSYTYDPAGNLLTLGQGRTVNGVNHLSSDISYSYDNRNRVTDLYEKIDDARSAHITYRYDKNGSKTEETEYADPGKQSYIRKTYAYDYAGRPIREEKVYQASDGQGGLVERGRVLTRYTLDDEGNILEQARYNGTAFEPVRYTYDHRNRVLEKTEPYASTGDTKTTTYTYDKRGNLQTKTIPRGGISCTHHYTYDGMGNLTAETDPLNHTGRYLYDACGNRIKAIDPRYYAEQPDRAPGILYEYDALNRQVKTIAYDGTKREVIAYHEYDGRGNMTKEAEGEGYNSQDTSNSYGNVYEYDIMDNVITYISAQTVKDNGISGCHTQKMTYDASGRVLTEEDGNGNQTQYAYTLRGKLKEKIYPDGEKETYTYDVTGELFTAKTDRAGHRTEIYRNLYGKPYKIQYPDGTEETFIYTVKGELKESYDRLGHVKYFAYDPMGNLTEKQEYIREDDRYAYYRLTRHTYDETGSLLSRETFARNIPKQGGAAVTLSAGDKVVHTYDQAGRLVKTEGPEGRETRYAYDPNGNLITQKQKTDNTDEDVTRYEYDSRSRMTAQSLLIETADIDGKQLQGADFDNEYASRVKATTRYTYDAGGQVKSKQDANGHIEHYGYDLDKRLVDKTDALQNRTTYVYDLNGNLVEEKNARDVSTYYEYDNLNRLIRKKVPGVEGEAAVTRYVYDVMGNLTKEILPNAYHAAKDTPSEVETMKGISYTYDNMNRRIATLSPEGDILTYVAYDANGNVQKAVDGLRWKGNIESSPGMIYSYNAVGQITEAVDALGSSTRYEYDILGNLTEQTDPKGHETRYRYNADGTLTQVTYADGGVITYAYDKRGRKTEQKDPRGHVTTYSYNGFGKIKGEQDPYGHRAAYQYDLNGNVVHMKDKRGSMSYFSYDALGRMQEKKMALAKQGSGTIHYAIEQYRYDGAGNMTQKTLTGTKDKDDTREIWYTYDDNNRVETVTDTAGSHVKYSYDQNGNIIKTETLRQAGAYNIEKYRYDSSNRLIAHIRLLDEDELYAADSIENLANLKDDEYPGKIRMITGHAYDILGNKTKEISPQAYAYPESDVTNRERHTVTFTYDPLNRLEKVIRKHDEKDVYLQYAYDPAGNRIEERDVRGNRTTYTYDSQNRLKTVTAANDSTMTYAYDPAGNKVSETNAKGHSITYAYDKMNRILSITDPYNVVISQREYDANGNLIGQTDAKGYRTTYAYNLGNLLVEMTDPENASTTYRYNQYGQSIRQTDGMGESTHYAYDSAGRLITVTDALGVSVHYGYDKTGNKLYMIDGRGKTSRYDHGSFGRMTAFTNAENKTVTYRYDLSGHLAAMTDRNGHTTVYAYDSRGLLTRKEVLETGDTVDYSYDEAGNRIGMTDESGTGAYHYDALNRLLTIEKDGSTQLRYSYDILGNIQSVTDQKGNTTSYTYDKASRMKTVSAGGRTATYDYDKNGNRASIVYGGGVKEEYRYNKNNRIIELINKKPGGTVISRYSYTYDKAERQITKTDSYGTTGYTYDKVGRILKVEAPGKTTVYAYDGAGNRISQHETYTSGQPTGYIDETGQKAIEYIRKKSEYVYSDANKLLTLVERMYDGDANQVLRKTTRYRYDANGNELAQSASHVHLHTIRMRQSTKGSVLDDTAREIDKLIERTHNTFDGFNRLKKAERIKDEVKHVVDYRYNGDNLRVRKVVQRSDEGYRAKVTNYLYDRQHVILETDAAGQTIVQYVRGVNYIARVDGGGKASYYLYNAHGDVVQTVSSAGEVENQYDYDIFGNPTLTLEQYAQSIRYAGEFYDPETGLYYLRARYYNPYTGRFVSEDSYWGEDVNPLSLNLYTYCYNDPIQFIDPTGHWGGRAGEYDDSKLSRRDQKRIKDLTDAWFSANDEDERTEINRAANAIRENAGLERDFDPDEKDDDDDDDNISRRPRRSRNRSSDRFSNEANEYLNNQEYFTADSWAQLSREHNRRSGGRYNWRAEQTVDTVIESITTDAERYSDYFIGSQNYIEDIDIIVSQEGQEAAIQQITVDAERVRESLAHNPYMNNEFEQMVAELMGRVDKDKKIQILLPTALPDGTPITARNKENEVTYNYFINYIYKTGMGYDSDVPYTAYSAWARDTYGENRLEKFWSSLEELVLNPEGDMLDNLQNLLDVGGMVPVYGEPIDGVNAIIYFIRGDRVNGYLSAGSMIPFISGGVQGVKLVKKGAKAVDAADTVIDTTRAVDKVVDVGKGAGNLAASIKWKGFRKGELATHYQKHVVDQMEFCSKITQNQYLKKAKDFALETGSGYKEEIVGNLIVKYDPSTRRVLVGHGKAREIRTFYIADDRVVDPFEAAVDLAKELSGIK